MKFAEAYEKLQEMAAGRNCAANVERSNYQGVIVGVYIEDVGWGHGANWEIAFLAIEAKIRALDGGDMVEATAGVDEVAA